MLAFALGLLLAQPKPPSTSTSTEKPPQAQKPLSDEDREIVKQMALLERLELVKNLELFEPEKDGGAKPPEAQRQP